METPAISIKLKGLDAISALNAKSPLFAGLKAKGAATLGKGTVMRLGEVETVRLGSIKASKVAAVAEINGSHVLITKQGKVLALCDPTGAGKGAYYLCPKAAVGTKAAAAGAAVKGGAMAGTSWGSWGLGLGPLGLGVLAGGLGLGVLGYYLYRRARQMAEEAEEEAID